jgi:hypothetical protein
MSFTKLDSGIVNSTLWLLPDDVLRVWVWFLSQADANGEVRTAAPPLAHICRIPLERMREILALLEGPDPDSRSPVEDGRRIEKIDGGWRLVNYAKYRANRDAEARTEYQRNWDREHRPSGHQRQSDSSTVRHGPTQSDTVRQQSDSSPTQSDQSDTVRHSPTQAEAEEEAEAEAEAEAEKEEAPNFSDEKLVVVASDNDPSPNGKQGDKAERCQVQELVNLYHEMLPELPRVLKITRARADAIRARWREDLPSIDQWRNFFGHVRQSDFLMGRVEPERGKRRFSADLEFLTKAGSFAKIAENKYHGKV